MKRGGPLKRNTPLKAGKAWTPNPPVTGAAKNRKPIKQVSAKRVEQNKERKVALAAVMFRSNGRCEASPIMGTHGIPEARDCKTYGTDGHEVLTRGRGGSITDPENILWVCSRCHQWITEHPIQAEAAGLVRNSWDK